MMIAIHAPDACAQADIDPFPVTNELIGDAPANGQSQTYSIDALPGEVVVAVDLSTNYESSNISIIVRDSEDAELLNARIPASTTARSQSLRFRVRKPQRLSIQLMFGMNIGVRIKYAIKLSGAIAGGATASGAIATPTPTPAPIPTPTPSTPVVATSSVPIEDKWALVVGVSDFAAPGVSLKYSAKDATDFSQFLIKEANFAPDHVKLLVNKDATKERVLAEIGDKWLPRVAHPNDLVVIFISTHGSPSQMDQEGLNYLVMHNTDPESLYATGLQLQELATAIHQRVHSDRVVLIIDACHSGSANPAKGIARTAGNVNTEILVQGTGQMVICSSEPQQVSWESKRYENSVFTHQLIEALRRADSKEPTLLDAFARMKDSVMSEVLNDRKELQTPVLKTKWQGKDLILSSPATKPRAVDTVANPY